MEENAEVIHYHIKSSVCKASFSCKQRLESELYVSILKTAKVVQKRQ